MQKCAGWTWGAGCYLCKYSTHLDYCGTAARLLGSKNANLMFSLLAGSTHARSMINPSKGGCLWGVTVLVELPLMDAHQAAVFGLMRWILVLLCSPGPGQALNSDCGPGISSTLLCLQLLLSSPLTLFSGCTTEIIKGFFTLSTCS